MVLSTKGFQVFSVAADDKALALCAECQPDMILLDLCQPKLFAYQACQSLREWYQGIIIILSMLEEYEYKLPAFTMGADDYLIKPVSIPELLARIEVHLRRMSQSAGLEPRMITIGSLSIDVPQRQVMLNGCTIKLTPIEFDILVMLTRHTNSLVTNAMLLQKIWGDYRIDDPRILHAHVSNLRKKLKSFSAHGAIKAEYGFGLRYVSE